MSDWPNLSVSEDVEIKQEMLISMVELTKRNILCSIQVNAQCAGKKQ